MLARGSKGQAEVNPKQVARNAEITTKYRAGTKQAQLAREYKLSTTQIRHILDAYARYERGHPISHELGSTLYYMLRGDETIDLNDPQTVANHNKNYYADHPWIGRVRIKQLQKWLHKHGLDFADAEPTLFTRPGSRKRPVTGRREVK